MIDSYGKDLSAWARHTAQLLRQRRFDDLDLEHLIEEVENLSKSERRAIASQLTRLLLHLLKWQYQPARRSDGWLDSIGDARLQIELTIEDSPSLKDWPQEKLATCYQMARRHAARQTGLPLSVFPDQCPYSIQQALNANWLPNG